MLFRQLFDRTSSTYTYLIASGIGREGLIIDPVIENISHYLHLLEELQLKLIFAVDTHTHADHITATGNLSQATQCRILMGEKSKAEYISVRVKDGEAITVDDIKLQAIYTPGHTDDSYCFLMKDRVFTGDTLLIRSTGRTDFQNGDSILQYESIFNKLFKLSDDIFVYPAHDYNGMTVSTIGEEKRFNPRLQVSSVAEYKEIMNNLKLSMPKLIDIAVPANLKCGIGFKEGENKNHA